MKLLKQTTIILSVLLFTYACKDNDTDEGGDEGGTTTVIITDVDFTISEENGKSNEVGVTPTSTNGTEYSIDFGDPSAVNDADIILSSGEKVNYTYPVPTPSATYTIGVTASAANAEDVQIEKQHTITEEVIIGGPCTTETTESMSGATVNLTFMSDQTANIITDNTLFEQVSNPDSENTVNTSCNVGKVTKTGTNPWDNTQIDFDSKFNFVDHSGFSIKVYSEVPGYKVLVKLEDRANAASNTEIDIQTTKTGEWEELFFEFPSSQSGKYDKLVLIFDLQQSSSNTYYFDDFKYYGTGDGGGPGTGLSGPFDFSSSVSFESDGYGAGWFWNIFENDDNPALTFVENPDKSGINTSSTVAKIIARSTGAPWVGTETQHGQFGTFTVDNSNKIVRIMVYKTKISDVGVKYATPSGGANGQILVPNTKVNEWEEITFDCSAWIGTTESINVDQLIIFPDFGDRNEDSITYFDNITFSAN